MSIMIKRAVEATLHRARRSVPTKSCASVAGGSHSASGESRTPADRARHTLMMPNWCFTDDDLIASDLVYADVRGETSRVIAFRATPLHEWIGGD